MNQENAMLLTVQGLQERIDSQPYTKLMGARVVALSADSCELYLPIRDELKQQYGYLHGGVLCYIADNAATIAGAASMQAPVVTSEFKINYIRPGLGEGVIARASCVHAGRSLAVCTCEVFAVSNGEEQLCALAQATISRLPDRKEKTGN